MNQNEKSQSNLGRGVDVCMLLCTTLFLPRNLPLTYHGGLDPHLIHHSLDPSDPPTQMSSRSSLPFSKIRSRTSWQKEYVTWPLPLMLFDLEVWIIVGVLVVFGVVMLCRSIVRCPRCHWSCCWSLLSTQNSTRCCCCKPSATSIHTLVSAVFRPSSSAVLMTTRSRGLASCHIHRIQHIAAAAASRQLHRYI